MSQQFFSGNLFQPYTPNSAFGYAGYDHRAVHGGLYPHIGTQQLMPYHGDPGWHPGFTGYGTEGDAPATDAPATDAPATPPAGPAMSGADIAALIAAGGQTLAALITAGASADAAKSIAEQAGLNAEQSAAYEAEIASLLTQIQAGQDSGTTAGATDAAMTADQLALLLSQAKAEQDEGMSPGAIAAIAVGGVALLGAIVFFATKAGRGAGHYGHRNYLY